MPKAGQLRWRGATGGIVLRRRGRSFAQPVKSMEQALIAVCEVGSAGDEDGKTRDDRDQLYTQSKKG